MRESLPDSIVFLGIGSNMGDPVRNCLEAINRIAGIPSTAVLHRSSLYRTEPVGIKDQPWFVNCVIEIRTALQPAALLQAIKIIEREMGRIPAERWQPRTIDIDILLYRQMVVQERDLQVPHPELHKRRFVLIPLHEIAPYVIHPGFGISVHGLLDRLEDGSKVERIEEKECW